MDAVFPFKNSENNDIELRFALRSLEKNLIGLGHVWIIGDRPNWTFTEHITWIKFPNLYAEEYFKQRNIVNKILCACNDNRISVKQEFLLCKDNQFLLAPTHEMSNYHKGRSWRSGNAVEANTRDLFPDRKINNFNTHSPFIVIPAVFKAYMTRDIDWTKPNGYCIKTTYAVKAGIDGEFYPYGIKFNGQSTFTKIDNVLTAGKRYFACNSTSFRLGVHKWLEEKFPEKSRFEI